MSVDKIILRAILSTLAAIGILIGFAFVMLVVAFPATTMEMAYDLGMENSCVRNAERAYKRKNDIYFIAYATDVAIGADNYKKTVSCGKKMIVDEEFAGYCAQKDEEYALYAEENDIVGITFDYEQYIYGNVCVAEYKLGDKQTAVIDAFEYTEGFKKNNAVVAVYYAARGENDQTTVSQIGEKMKQVQKDTFSAEEQAYYQLVLGWING